MQARGYFPTRRYTPQMPKEQRGPKGGRTTRTAGGLIRKSVILTPELDGELRRRAYQEQRSESEIIRDALAALFWPDDEEQGK